MVNILVVEDEINTQHLIQKVLTREHFNVTLANNGSQALALFENYRFDLIISDIMMPHMDGYDLVDEIRKINPSIPILMITALESLEDKRKGFRLGNYDYMVKPIDFDEMILRIYALLRRCKINSQQQLRIHNTTLDYDSLTVSTPDKTIELPKKEFALLFHLLSYKNKIFTRSQLLDSVWNIDSESEEHTVDVHINRLRNKFNDNPDFEIITIRGLGYKAVEK